MKKIFFMVIILLLASGILPYVHKVKLTNDDLKWINHYKVQERLYYISNQNDTDTLIVKDVEVWNPKNTFPFDPEGHNWIEVGHEYDGVADVTMDLLHSGDTFVVNFGIKRDDTGQPLLNSCNFCEWSWIRTRIQEKTVTILSRNFKGCISVDVSQMERNDGDQPVIGLRQVIWNKEVGLLQYSLKNGISYTQRKIIHE